MSMRIHHFKQKKQQKNKISMITCYDYPSAIMVDKSTIDAVLVGDSVAMAVYGCETTIMATMDMIVMHTQAVARGLEKKFLVSDLPFLSYRISRVETIHNVKRLLQAGAHAVKIEGGDADVCQTIRYLVDAGIPVMGHIGLTAQFIHQLGGYKIQGKEQKQAEALLQQAYDLEQAGCFALVVECVPQQVAKTITQALEIPTIGIGAGADTDGQILVWHDLLGLHDFKPRFIKQYLQGQTLLVDAINVYAQEVRQAQFPTEKEAF